MQAEDKIECFTPLQRYFSYKAVIAHKSMYNNNKTIRGYIRGDAQFQTGTRKENNFCWKEKFFILE